MVCRLDNSAARQLVIRSGVSKIRHIEARMLWLQDKAKSKAFSVAGISTVWNTADLGTKGLTGERINMLLYMLGIVDAENGFKPVGEEEFERETEKQANKKMFRSICEGLAEGTSRTIMNPDSVKLARAILAMGAIGNSLTFAVAEERLETMQCLSPIAITGAEVEEENGGSQALTLIVILA